jgi:uncharacterized Fe-S center protein
VLNVQTGKDRSKDEPGDFEFHNLAVDQASIDLVYALPDEESHDLKERIESRKGLRQLTYMKELGMGHDRYELVEL